jgi:hypothetical protein
MASLPAGLQPMAMASPVATSRPEMASLLATWRLESLGFV